MSAIILLIKAKRKDLLHGGLADKRKRSDFPEDQVKLGLRVEREHTDDQKIALEIVMDHLSESKNYYTELEKIEKKTKKKK